MCILHKNIYFTFDASYSDLKPAGSFKNLVSVMGGTHINGADNVNWFHK